MRRTPSESKVISIRLGDTGAEVALDFGLSAELCLSCQDEISVLPHVHPMRGVSLEKTMNDD